jgi:uncharacterized protein DUF6076
LLASSGCEVPVDKEKLIEFDGFRYTRGYRLEGKMLRPNIPIRDLDHETAAGKEWPDKAEWQARRVISGVAEYPPEIEKYEPPDDLHVRFANLANAADVLNFANEFGLLKSPPHSAIETALDVAEIRDTAEPLSDWLDAIAKMKGAIEQIEAARKSGAEPDGRRGKLLDALVAINTNLNHAPLQLRVVFDQPIRFESRLRPQNLRAFLATQLTQALATGHAWLRCRGCDEWFVFKEIAGRHPGRFNRRRTCSDSCRVKAYNKDREEARRLHAGGMAAKGIVARLKDQGWEPSPTSTLSAVKQVKKWLQS